MMMPANYSVIAENEMTYVNGGALIDCFAPLMTSSNWKTFNTNLIKIIGNSAMANFLSSTVGVLFGGEFSFENWGDTLEGNYWKGFDSVNNGLNTVPPWAPTMLRPSTTIRSWASPALLCKL